MRMSNSSTAEILTFCYEVQKHEQDNTEEGLREFLA